MKFSTTKNKKYLNLKKKWKFSTSKNNKTKLKNCHKYKNCQTYIFSHKYKFLTTKIKCFQILLKNLRFFKSFSKCRKNQSWAPQAQREAWEVNPWETYRPDHPPRPSRSKAGLGLVMMMMMMMMMTKMMMTHFVGQTAVPKSPIHYSVGEPACLLAGTSKFWWGLWRWSRSCWWSPWWRRWWWRRQWWCWR